MQNKPKKGDDYLDVLAVKAKLGSMEAIEELDRTFLPICLKIASSMIKSYRINMDTSEPGDYLVIIHETVIKATKQFNPYVGDFKNYFLASFVTNLYSELDKEYSENIALFNAISLDALAPKSNNRTYHEIVTSNYDDLSKDYDVNEAKSFIFSDTNIERHEKRMRLNADHEAKAKLQKYLIMLKYYGCTIEEIAKIFGVSKYVIKRLMFDDNDYMPLGKLKKIFNKN